MTRVSLWVEWPDGNAGCVFYGPTLREAVREWLDAIDGGLLFMPETVPSSVRVETEHLADHIHIEYGEVKR